MIKKNPLHVVVIILLLVASPAVGQIAPIPPTPTASALAKYGEIPVKMFIGAPDITIPLYEVKQSGVSVPISLNYLATGIKVEEVASWVGLNWSLSAGGAITRSVRGVKDEDVTFGYFNQIDDIETIANKNKTTWTTTDMNVLEDFAKGKRDASPDVFYINLPGVSGKFVYDHNQVAHTIPYSNTKIEKGALGATGIESFVVTAENGTMYYLGKVDGRTAIDATTSLMECGDGGQPTTANTTWHLLKIEPVTGSPINFFYDSSYGYQYTNPNASERITYRTVGIGARQFVSSGDCISTYTLSGDGLSKIESEDIRVVFVSSTGRQDMANDLRLDKVEIRNRNTNALLKDYLLGYSYYNPTGTATEKRLRLDNVTERGELGQSLPPYQFTYEGNSIPSRTSKAQDHWGYPNDEPTDQSLVPVTINGRTFQGGGSRAASSTASLAGSLERITYPTGGYTEFEYEPNMAVKKPEEVTYSDCVSDPYCNVMTHSISTNCDPPSGALCQNASLTFTMTNKRFENARLTVTFSTNAMSDYGNTPEYECNAFSSFSGTYYPDPVLHPGATQSLTSCTQGNSMVHIVSLEKGQNYTMSLTKGEDGVRSSMSLTYYEYDEPAVLSPILGPTGGLRVKKVTQYDGVNHANDQIKEYSYSPGVLVTKPQYFSSWVIQGYDAAVYESASSNSQIALGSAQSSHVCYENVTEKIGMNGSNGTREYDFSYYADDNYPSLTYVPFVPRISKDWLRGFMESKVEKNNLGAQLQRYTATQKDDETRNKTEITWYVVGDGVLINGLSNESEQNYHRFDIATIEHVSQWVYQDYSSQKVYNPTDDTKFVGTVTNFNYAETDHAQLTSQTTTDSKGRVLETEYRYPQDYTSPSSTINTMISKNMIGLPVEQIQKVDGQVVAATATEYEYDTTNDAVRMKSTHQFETTVPGTGFSESSNGTTFSSYNKRLTVHKYDGKGNVLEYAKEGDVHSCYIWGYNQMYPVAQVINATFAQIEALSGFGTSFHAGTGALTSTQANTLRSGLPGAQVTTYTYKVGIGILTVTDPNGRVTNYEYDEFGRLERVRDHDGNILQQNEYNYGN
ncbi:MAG: hypothetical protein RIM99_10345 [Cyclobacteriaceae bacterium]